MSDTPETDTKQHFMYMDVVECVEIDFARKLERERNSLQDQRDFCMGEIERLRKERDEARNIARWLYQHGMATLIEGAHRNKWIKEKRK